MILSKELNEVIAKVESVEECIEAQKILSAKVKLLEAIQLTKFKVDDPVWIIMRSGKKFKGVIVKIKRSTINVKSENGPVYVCSPSLVQMRIREDPQTDIKTL